MFVADLLRDGFAAVVAARLDVFVTWTFCLTCCVVLLECEGRREDELLFSEQMIVSKGCGSRFPRAR